MRTNEDRRSDTDYTAKHDAPTILHILIPFITSIFKTETLLKMRKLVCKIELNNDGAKPGSVKHTALVAHKDWANYLLYLTDAEILTSVSMILHIKLHVF